MMPREKGGVLLHRLFIVLGHVERCGSCIFILLCLVLIVQCIYVYVAAGFFRFGRKLSEIFTESIAKSW